MWPIRPGWAIAPAPGGSAWRGGWLRWRSGPRRKAWSWLLAVILPGLPRQHFFCRQGRDLRKTLSPLYIIVHSTVFLTEQKKRHWMNLGQSPLFRGTSSQSGDNLSGMTTWCTWVTAGGWGWAKGSKRGTGHWTRGMGIYTGSLLSKFDIFQNFSFILDTGTWHPYSHTLEGSPSP